MLVAIIGFGVVGRSVLHYFSHPRYIEALRTRWTQGNPYTIMVWDAHDLSFDDKHAIQAAGATFSTGDDIGLEQVLASCMIAVVSPGVDLSAYEAYEHKCKGELDVLVDLPHIRTVGITGSLGKTTTTKLLGCLAQRCAQPSSVFIGGNIGRALLDMAIFSEQWTDAILELSSFQLERNRRWAPDIAMWTNCYANHLDRHKTMQAYVTAKQELLRYQTKGQKTLLSQQLFHGELGAMMYACVAQLKSDVYLVGEDKEVCLDIMRKAPSIQGCITCEHNAIVLVHVGDEQSSTVLALRNAIPDTITFFDNWLLVIGALYFLYEQTYQADFVHHVAQQLTDFAWDNEYRCELVATHHGIDFYNDSKATVIQSTAAAVWRLAQQKRPMVLLLGGLGKGVSRTSLLDDISTCPELKKIYCFGPECVEFSSNACCFSTLDDVFEDMKRELQSGDIVLFSPSGTSFDFYKNYRDRGAHFNQLVKALSDSEIALK